MTDLISRKALLEFAHNHVDGTIDCNDIARYPAVDAAPVVHCCACKCYETDTGFCRYWESGTLCDDFCSRGEKMDGKV